ncbi:MAG: rhomboid family intramembrane serine protease [Planctomycetota bacterium]
MPKHNGSGLGPRPPMQTLFRRLHLALGGTAVASLIAINCGVFALTVVIGPHLFGRSLDGWLGVSLPGLVEGFGLGSLRIVTSQFTHAFTDPMHLFGNMLVLFFLGRMVESEVGSRGLVHLYLTSGLAGVVVALALFALTGHPDATLIGASGACYGIMVYGALMAPRQTVMLFFVVPVQLGALVGILVALGFYYAAMQIHGLDTSRVAHSAHIGGAAAGFIAFRRFRGYYLALGSGRGAWFPGLARRRQERDRTTAVDKQLRLDRILDKVQREGMSALSGEERRFLERTSKEMRDRP